MAEQKIQAGKTIDTVTKKELHDALSSQLRSWMAETAAGGKYVRFTATGTIASAAVTIGGAGPTLQDIGPGPGFVWDVRRLHISGLVTADVAGVYINDASSASIIGATTDLPAAAIRSFLWSHQVVLYPGDNLLVANIGALAATGTVTVTGQALELPIGLAWKLSS
jgi:hypothetical protein